MKETLKKQMLSCVLLCKGGNDTLTLRAQDQSHLTNPQVQWVDINLRETAKLFDWFAVGCWRAYETNTTLALGFGQVLQEPDEVKVSSPDLKTRETIKEFP